MRFYIQPYIYLCKLRHPCIICDYILKKNCQKFQSVKTINFFLKKSISKPRWFFTVKIPLRHTSINPSVEKMNWIKKEETENLHHSTWVNRKLDWKWIKPVIHDHFWLFSNYIFQMTFKRSCKLKKIVENDLRKKTDF